MSRAPAWRPWEATARPAPPARPVPGFDAQREQTLIDLLRHVSPKLLLATKSVAGVPWDSSSGKFPYLYANPGKPQLTEHGDRMLKLWGAVLDLSQLGYGDTIPKPVFEAFARARNLDATKLARHLAVARNRMPDGRRQFPGIQDVSEAADAVASLRRIHAAALSKPSPAFLAHLHVVNKPLEIALRWIASDPTARPAPSLNEFATLHGVKDQVRSYVHALYDDASLSDVGMPKFAYELAAFDWIRMGRPDWELQLLAAARGLAASQIRSYATRAVCALRSHSASADDR